MGCWIWGFGNRVQSTSAGVSRYLLCQVNFYFITTDDHYYKCHLNRKKNHYLRSRNVHIHFLVQHSANTPQKVDSKTAKVTLTPLCTTLLYDTWLCNFDAWLCNFAVRYVRMLDIGGQCDIFNVGVGVIVFVVCVGIVLAVKAVEGRNMSNVNVLN